MISNDEYTEIGDLKSNLFAGYFDLNISRKKNDKKFVLAYSASVLSAGDAELRVYDLDTLNYRVIHKSPFWNIQQGMLAQYLNDDSGSIIFNGAENGRPATYFFDGQTLRKNKIFDDGYGALSRCAKYIVLQDYFSISKFRVEYGFKSLMVDDFVINNENRVFAHCCFNSREILEEVSLEDILEVIDVSLESVRGYWATHFSYSPDARLLAFIFRYIDSANNLHTTFLVKELFSKALRLIRQGQFSHYTWIGNDTVLSWSGDRKVLSAATSLGIPIMPFLKKLYRLVGKPSVFKSKVVGDSYHIDNLVSGENRRLKINGLHEDGHCAAVFGSDVFITDTYVDSRGTARLLAVDHSSEKIISEVALSGLDVFDFEYRCDLHPRFTANNKVAVDVSLDGRRRIRLYDCKGSDFTTVNSPKVANHV